MLALVLALGLVSPSASACGGFFCDGGVPLDTGDGNPWNNGDISQSGEGIVFSVANGVTTMTVEVQYQGDAQSFAWVLPLPAAPTVAVATDDLFTDLDAATAPQVTYSTHKVDCQEFDADADTDSDTDSDTDADTDTDTDTDTDVWVVSSSAVGPYQSTVLQATTTEALVDWLQTNGYRVPSALANALAPYLTPTTNFLALRLNKETFSGDLAPIELSWTGTDLAIPIQLTQIAAVDDMPMTVYFLGPSRAVPLSYLHVQLNPLGLPWIGGPTWDQRVGEAADEAGTHAFATAYAGDPYVGTLWSPTRWNLVGLDQITDPLTWLESLPGRGFTANEELLDVLRVVVPAPPGANESLFYDFTPPIDQDTGYGHSAWEYADDWHRLADKFDPVAATAALDEAIVQPHLRAQQQVDAAGTLTRLETSMSPQEMSVDPTFGFNPDLPDVSRYLTATMTWQCGGGPEMTAPRELSFAGGKYVLPIPPQATLLDRGVTDSQYLQSRLIHRGLVVEQLSESGPGTVLVDWSSELDWPSNEPQGVAAAPLADDEPAADANHAAGGCGCASGGGRSMIPLLPLLLVIRRSRTLRS